MRQRTPLVAASSAVVVAVSLLAAGCGGGAGTPQVASVQTSTTTGGSAVARTAAVAYTHCMRSRGIVNFPDPSSSGRYPASSLKNVGGSKEQFRTADLACTHLLPGGGLAALVVGAAHDTRRQQRVQLADELSFARCMRSHGVTRFPDPTAQAQLSVEVVQAAGVDVRSPAVLRVVRTCLPASHGGLTAAKVREALANAGH